MKLTIIFNHYFSTWFHEYKDASDGLAHAHLLTLRLLEDMKGGATPVTDLDVLASQLLEEMKWEEITATLDNIYCNRLGVWL